jgi:hypothetical protein
MLVGSNRYIRTGSLALNEDIKLYDVANLQLATVGQAGATVIGELWVEYDIILEVPNSQNIVNVSNLSSGYQSGGGTWAITALQGSVPVVSVGQVGISTLLNVVTLSNLSPGTNYMVIYLLSATTTITTAPTITLTSGFASLATQFSLTNGTTDAAVNATGLCTNSVAVIALGGVTVLVGGISSIIIVNPTVF